MIDVRRQERNLKIAVVRYKKINKDIKTTVIKDMPKINTFLDFEI